MTQPATVKTSISQAAGALAQHEPVLPHPRCSVAFSKHVNCVTYLPGSILQVAYDP